MDTITERLDALFAMLVAGAGGGMPTLPGSIPTAASPALWSVLLPALVSIIVLGSATLRGPNAGRLLITWIAVLPAMYLASFWREMDGVLTLQIVPLFSIAVLIMLWRGQQVSPAMAYALSFVSLLAIDLTRAVEFALTHGIPLAGFLRGIGGAGIGDGLFLFPIMTAVLVVYATWRMKHRTAQQVAQPVARPTP